MERIRGFNARLLCRNNSVTNIIRGSDMTFNPYCSGFLSKHPLSFEALKGILVERVEIGSKNISQSNFVNG